MEDKYLINQFSLGAVADVNYCIIQVLTETNKVLCKQFSQNLLELIGDEVEFDIDYLIDNANFTYTKYNRVPQDNINAEESVYANDNILETCCNNCNCTDSKFALKQDIINIMMDNCWVEDDNEKI